MENQEFVSAEESGRPGAPQLTPVSVTSDGSEHKYNMDINMVENSQLESFSQKSGILNLPKLTVF